jgi:hypothetical protein
MKRALAGGALVPGDEAVTAAELRRVAALPRRGADRPMSDGGGGLSRVVLAVRR